MRELSLHIMDIAQNSIAAEASLVRIMVMQNTILNNLKIHIEDNGCGMDSVQLQKAQSPFYSTRTARSIGMGIPLLKMACEMTGGSLAIRSKPECGTAVSALFHTGHIDMIPLGDMNETMLLLISCNPDIDFVYRFSRDGSSFTLDTRELRGIMEEIPLNSPGMVPWIRGYLAGQTAAL